ncbi:sugar ABC transporter permease [Cohnella sp. WQ 127256]|uniref:ABC transporter permease n=1 Tax=Cohnella sp. WQ 127256 TaxID=2938790 RepID=UPI00211880CE|nr:ABC transporter permease subunit [Cohnella sp. WQ 127256]
MKKNMTLHLMLLPGMAILFVFAILPMLGAVIAFQDFNPALGVTRSPWSGWANFTFMFQIPDSKQVFTNTLVIACMKIISGLVVPLLFALLLNEMRLAWFKKSVQTIVYLPHFLSWVILSGIVLDLLSYDGIINHILSTFGLNPIMFMSNNHWFRWILVFTDTWKEFGFNTIIYLAALTGINPSLYEAAAIDGAARMKQIRHVTLPTLLPTIILLATLAIGNVLNAGFDQIFNLYNPLVYESGDIIDTYVYRTGLIEQQYGLATAIGLMKSVVSFLLIIVSYRLAYKFANYRIF